MITVLIILLKPTTYTERNAALLFLQVVFHHGINDLLCNWIPEGMRDCAAANSDFGSNVLFLPALKVKLDDQLWKLISQCLEAGEKT